MIEQYSNTNVITKFQFRNKWFNGCYIIINYKNILAHTIGTDVNQTFTEYFNQQQIYTSIVSHNHNIWSVCSSSKNIYKHGFIQFLPFNFSKEKVHLIAYYRSKDQSKKALLIKILLSYQYMKTLNEPPLLSFIRMYEEKYIALFELDGHDKYVFLV